MKIEILVKYLIIIVFFAVALLAIYFLLRRLGALG